MPVSISITQEPSNLNQNQEESSNNGSESSNGTGNGSSNICLKRCSVFLEVFSIIFAGLLIVLDISIIINNCNQLLTNWIIMALVSHFITLLLNLHSFLKNRYHFFALRRKFFKIIKVFLYFGNHVLGWVLIGLAMGSVNQSLVDSQCSEGIVSLYNNIVIYQFVVSCSTAFMTLCMCCLICAILGMHTAREIQEHQGVSPETITQHSMVKTFSEWMGIDSSCPICMEDYGSDDKITKLPCGHYFHEECVGEWLKNSQVCPFCRQKITKAEDLHTGGIHTEGGSPAEVVTTV